MKYPAECKLCNSAKIYACDECEQTLSFACNSCGGAFEIDKPFHDRSLWWNLKRVCNLCNSNKATVGDDEAIDLCNECNFNRQRERRKAEMESKTPRTEPVDSGLILQNCQDNYAKLATAHQKTQKELAEARAEIERLRARNAILDKAIAEMTEEQAQICAEGQSIAELVAAKDALIEQMKESIRFSLSADEIRHTGNFCASAINDACETSRVKRIAALEAAERGE